MNVTATNGESAVNSVSNIDNNLQAKKTNKGLNQKTNENNKEQELIANTISMLAMGQAFELLKTSPSSIEAEKARREIFSSINPTAMDE